MNCVELSRAVAKAVAYSDAGNLAVASEWLAVAVAMFAAQGVTV